MTIAFLFLNVYYFLEKLTRVFLKNCMLDIYKPCRLIWSKAVFIDLVTAKIA